MYVSEAPFVSFSCFHCVGCSAELSRIKATLPLEKGYGVPYYRVAVRERKYTEAEKKQKKTNKQTNTYSCIKFDGSVGKPETRLYFLGLKSKLLNNKSPVTAQL